MINIEPLETICISIVVGLVFAVRAYLAFCAKREQEALRERRRDFSRTPPRDFRNEFRRDIG